MTKLLKVSVGSTLQKLTAEVKKRGGKVIQAFPPFVIATLPGKPKLIHGALTTAQASATNLQERSAAAVMQRLSPTTSIDKANARTQAKVQHVHESWDAPGRIPPGVRQIEPPLPGPSPASTGTPTSLTMTDQVAVALVIVYRRDSTTPEHISLAQRDFITQEAGEAYAWLAQVEPRANLSFVLERHDVELDVAPDPHASATHEAKERIWRDPALIALGHVKGRLGYARLARDVRDRHNTKWGLVLFVTLYPVSEYAYASHERVVQHFGNGGRSVDQLNNVIAHETCHVFGALDEYGSCSCATTGGELDVENGNCRNCAVTFEDCIMESTRLELCSFTRGQLGWEPPIVA